jgi:hypothetical protein
MRNLDFVEIERHARRLQAEEIARLFASLAEAIGRMISTKGASSKQVPVKPAMCQ